MNTQKQAMSKIAQIQKEDKVELSEVHKIELTKINDLSNALESLYKKEDSVVRNILGLQSDLEKVGNQYDNLIKEINRIESNLKSSDLGDYGVDIGIVLDQLDNIKTQANYAASQNRKAQQNIKNVKSFY